MSSPDPIIAVYTRSGYPSSEVEQSVPNYADTNVNTLILSGPNGDNGEIVYNDPPNTMFNAQGQYVGDTAWPASLAGLTAKTNIESSRIFFSLSNSAISTLAAMDASALASVMAWLKANGIAGIDMDCEDWGQVGGLKPMAPACKTVTKAAIAAGLALTAAPYNRQGDWQKWCAFVSQNNGSVSWLNVQCYAGGYGNNPVTGWFTQFDPSVPVVAGVEASPGTDEGALTPDQAQKQWAAWQAETPANSLAGAFVWEYGIITSGKYTVGEYAQAMSAGLGIHPGAAVQNGATFTVNVPAGPVWDQKDAETKAPAAAAAHQGKWNGQWTTVVEGEMSVVGVELKVSNTGPNSYKTTVLAGPLWSNESAQQIGPVIAASYGARFTGQWKTIVAGVMSVIEIEYSF